MDWTTPLRAQQADFIQRLKSGYLLRCEIEGQHSELTVISGESLQKLVDFCWEMAEKYKRDSPVRKVFIGNMKGKLGEEVVKERLADFVTEVDYEKRLGGDGKVDFRLTSNPSVGIQVKSSYCSLDRVQWKITPEEVNKNAVLVCIFSQEEFSDRQSEYKLIIAGFLPTDLIKESGQGSFSIDELLYGGGLRSYLEFLQSPKQHQTLPAISSLAVLKSQPAKTQLKMKPQPLTLYLGSERGIDYTELHDFLATGKWEQADQMTAEVMQKIAGYEKFPWLLDVKDIEKFPCEDLHTIDHLWVKYSDGRFGFTVQKDIWQNLGITTNVDYETHCFINYCRFGERVGWSINVDWLNYSSLTFNLSSPIGHLPVSWVNKVRNLRAGGSTRVYKPKPHLGFSALIERISICSVE
jgi:hypothetical protein